MHGKVSQSKTHQTTKTDAAKRGFVSRADTLRILIATDNHLVIVQSAVARKQSTCVR